MVRVDMPEMRIGDAERDEAVTRLREHYAAGRLTAAEFEERMSTAIAAHTRSELVPLFTDLPRDPNTRYFTAAQDGTSPGNQLAPSNPAPPPARPPVSNPALRRALDVAVAVAWPAAIVAMISGAPWWIIFIPIFLLPALRAGMFGSHAEREAREQRRELRRDERDRRRDYRHDHRHESSRDDDWDERRDGDF